MKKLAMAVMLATMTMPVFALAASAGSPNRPYKHESACMYRDTHVANGPGTTGGEPRRDRRPLDKGIGVPFMIGVAVAKRFLPSNLV